MIVKSSIRNATVLRVIVSCGSSAELPDVVEADTPVWGRMVAGGSSAGSARFPLCLGGAARCVSLSHFAELKRSSNCRPVEVLRVSRAYVVSSFC